MRIADHPKKLGLLLLPLIPLSAIGLVEVVGMVRGRNEPVVTQADNHCIGSGYQMPAPQPAPPKPEPQQSIHTSAPA